MNRKNRIAAVLLAILLLTAGCSQPGRLPETETVGETTGETTGPVLEDASLTSLRQAMVETPQLFAVAYFGYHDSAASHLSVDPVAVMEEIAPQLCRDLPFLTQIPQERILGEKGDLFCIVPLEEAATVAVSKGSWEESRGEYLYEESRYFSEKGDPILLFCNGEGFEPDTQLRISGPSGEVTWYPQTDDNRCAMPLRNDNWESLFLDISPYREMLKTQYRDMQDKWEMPTAEMLRGTTWVWEGDRKDGLETSYQVTFGEDTLYVRWNDGLEEEDYVFRNAPWEIHYEDGMAVLTIDFQGFAGVRRYNLLYHEQLGQLYVGLDVLREEMGIGWESLYRFLTPPGAPEPVEMLGQWELAWTEVEGDRNEAEPETEWVTIFLDDDNAMHITLEDSALPQNSFYHKELAVYEEEMYPGCGNDQWMAYVDYADPYDTIYSVTLLTDGTLLMELYWEVEGAPMVAHKGYRPVN